MHNGLRTKAARAAKGRDLERTRRRILAAALREFVDRGFDGARTRAIARRAGVHEWMVFYCFGSKRELYREVLSEQLALRTRMLAEMPADFTGALQTASKSFARNRDVIRLFQWEALTARKGDLIAAQERRDAFRQGSEWLEKLQREGALPAGLDLTFFRMALVALGAFPLAFPQMVELAVGIAPKDPRFQKRWNALVHWFVERVMSEPSLGLRESAKPQPPAHQNIANGEHAAIKV
jgi:TetR/AcrR family transcriptional regulator